MPKLHTIIVAVIFGLSLGLPALAQSKPEVNPMGQPRQSGYARVNGLNMYYEVHGEGPPLVLLHGGITTIEASFSAILPTLAKTRTVIAVEQQAHGRTADIGRPLTFEQEADDTAAVLRKLGINQADVLGYSDGGNVGLGLAIRHPGLVRKLVVIGTNADNGGLQPGILDFMKVAAEQDPAEAAKTMPPELREAYVKVAPRPQDWPILVSKVMKQAATLKGWTPEQLKSVKAPVLVMVGDADIIRAEHAVEMFRLFGGGGSGDMGPMPTSRLAVMPGANHMSFMTSAEAWLPMIANFLDAPMPAK